MNIDNDAQTVECVPANGSASERVREMRLTVETTDVIRRFNNVFLRHDPSALPELLSPDCVIESIKPAPHGAQLIGRDACVANWTEIATAPGTHFDLEEVFVAGDRAIIRWRFCWGEGEANSSRGVNLMRVRDGLIVEAMGYAKGA